MSRLPHRAPAALSLALALALPGPVLAGGDSKKNAEAEKTFLDAYRSASSDDSAREKAVKDLNDAPDAVKVSALLKKVLPKEEAPGVISAAVGVLRGVADPEAVKILTTEAIERGPWQVRGAAIEALGGVRDPAGVEALRKIVKAGGDPKPLAAAAFALAQTRSADAMPEVLTLLGHGAWQVRLGAFEYLAVMRDPKSVPALVDRLETETGRLRREIADILQAVTGKSYGMDAAKWRAYAAGGEAAADAVGSGKPGDPAAGGGTRDVATGGVVIEPTYYGEPIYSDKVIFVIDLSLSMNDEMVVDRDMIVRETGAIASGGGADGKTSDPPRDDDVMPIEWWKIRTRMDFARSQLKYAISTMKKDQWFDVVWFSDSVKTWQGRMVAASRSNKYRAAEWIDSLKCEGGTNTWGGLSKALHLVGTGTADENYSRGADTIYFLSDGEPSVGDIKDKDHILAAIERIHKVRRVKINVVHIGPSQMHFLQALASRTGGRYKFFNAKGPTRK